MCVPHKFLHPTLDFWSRTIHLSANSNSNCRPDATMLMFYWVSSWPSAHYYCSSLVMHEIIGKKKKKWSWCGFGKKYQPLWAKWVIRSRVQFEPLAPRKLDVELGLAMCTYTHLGIVSNTLLPTHIILTLNIW